MTDTSETKITRRELLRRGGLLASAGLVAPMVPAWVVRADGRSLWQAVADDPVAKFRADMAAIPIERAKLSDNLTLLSGPGGNVVVSNGPDGKLVVDCFVQPAWDKLRQTLEELGSTPVKAVINTHWHFDHADNNANLRKLGAAVVAHENTRKRLSETHEIAALGMKFPPAPPDALPTQTFKDSHKLDANGEQMVLGYIPPAHTDTDIYIRFAKGNVLHLGDLFFNGMYPFIDASTRGSINGMIAGTDIMLKMADRETKVVPGHGPLGDRTALMSYRDMMVTVRDRVRKLKSSGRTRDEVVAAAPTKDLDATWGKGFMPPAVFVGIVYDTL